MNKDPDIGRTDLIDLLRELPATGENGFEGLIAALLEALTEQHFYLAKSGSQNGRDMSATRNSCGVIAVECKRYGKKSELDERSLLGEIAQAVRDIPDLDIWILATSREISSQLDSALRWQTVRVVGNRL